MNWLKKHLFAVLALAGLAPLALSDAFATDTPPLDLSATGTTVASYIADAALAGVAILAALYGIRVIIRAFKSVK